MAPSPIRDSTAQHLRRRRAASFRCPAFADGRRDPLDPARTRPVITVRAIGKCTVEFIGNDKVVFSAIKTVGARYQRKPSGGAWLLEQSGAEDVIALLEHRGHKLDVAL